MKYYTVEPTVKKSLYETEIFSKFMGDGTAIHARLQSCWRWGSYMIAVPETVDEIDEWCEAHGVQVEDFGGYDAIIENLLPDPESEYTELGDYEYDNLETFDGISADWEIEVFGPSSSKIDKDELLKQIEDAWEKDWLEGIENLGFESVGTEVEIYCPLNITECDEQGNPLNVMVN